MVIVVFDGVQPLDVVGPHEVFAGADILARQQGRGGYRIIVVAAHSYGEPVVVRAESGLGLAAEALPDPGLPPIDTMVLAGGSGVHRASRDVELVDWVQVVARRARRVVTVTTHWARAARLAREFPAVTVDAEAIYRREGAVWTSAGVSAGIDLALASVEDDHGAQVAQEVARWLVVSRHRGGGQSQYATPTWTPRGQHAAVRAAQENVEAAREALETSAATVETIAASCGFGTAETLRRVFHRRLGVAPDAYRQRFARHPHPAAPPRTRAGDLP